MTKKAQPATPMLLRVEMVLTDHVWLKVVLPWMVSVWVDDEFLEQRRRHEGKVEEVKWAAMLQRIV
jgi:hypothetical protein